MKTPRATHTNCPVCGFDLTINTKGRPAEKHPDCRKLENLLSWAEDLILAIDYNTASKIKRTRSRLFYLSNLMNSKKPQQLDLI